MPEPALLGVIEPGEHGLGQRDCEFQVAGFQGRFVNLFDSELRIQTEITVKPNSRYLLLDLDAPEIKKRSLLASACKAILKDSTRTRVTYAVEGVGETPGIILFQSARPPRQVTLAGKPLDQFEYSAKDKLLWLRFENTASARELSIQF